MSERILWIEPSYGDPRTGGWCDDCMTSAVVEVDVYRLAEDGPRQLGTVARCTRCDTGEEP